MCNLNIRFQMWCVDHRMLWFWDMLFNFSHPSNVWRRLAYIYHWGFDRFPLTKPARFVAGWAWGLAGALDNERLLFGTKCVGRNVCRYTFLNGDRGLLRSRFFCGWYKITYKYTYHENIEVVERPITIACGFCYTKRKAYRVLEGLMKNTVIKGLFPAGWVHDKNWGHLMVIKACKDIIEGKEPSVFGVHHLDAEFKAAKKIEDKLRVWVKDYMLYGSSHWHTQTGGYIREAYRVAEHLATEKSAKKKKALFDEFVRSLDERYKTELTVWPDYKADETMWFE